MRTAVVSGVAVITEACLDVNDRSCVDVCPVQCIYEFDEPSNLLVSEMRAGSGVAERTHTACLQTSVCPVGAIYAEGLMPDGSSAAPYNLNDPTIGHDHSWFAQHSRNVFAG